MIDRSRLPSSSYESGSGATVTERDEKWSTSWATPTTVAWVVGRYDPAHRSECATGHSPARSSSQIGYGSRT